MVEINETKFDSSRDNRSMGVIAQAIHFILCEYAKLKKTYKTSEVIDMPKKKVEFCLFLALKRTLVNTGASLTHPYEKIRIRNGRPFIKSYDDFREALKKYQTSLSASAEGVLLIQTPFVYLTPSKSNPKALRFATTVKELKSYEFLLDIDKINLREAARIAERLTMSEVEKCYESYSEFRDKEDGSELGLFDLFVEEDGVDYNRLEKAKSYYLTTIGS